MSPTTLDKPDEFPLLQALRGQKPPYTPVWFMRQAGRSLPEYRAIRRGQSMLQACVNPELTAEITLQPVRRLGVDGAIFYSDIVVPLYLAKVPIDIVPGKGPTLEHPLRTSQDIDEIIKYTQADFSPITQAGKIISAELSTMGQPGARPTLLGFAGAPFTIASYLIEGARSRNQMHTRALIAKNPEAWRRLAGWCARLSREFLAAQVAGGAGAVQLFDSWAGSLSPDVYEKAAAPFSAEVFKHKTLESVPKIHFALGSQHLLPTIVKTIRPDALGLDWRTNLTETAADYPELALQGNLDPAFLFANRETLLHEVDQVMSKGSTAHSHIFNLGHGVDPQTDPDRLKLIVQRVHETESGEKNFTRPAPSNA